MPNPNKNESKEKYISRCVVHLMKKEGKTNQQALGQCYGMWKQSKKRKEVKGDASEPDFDKENNLGIADFLP